MKKQRLVLLTSVGCLIDQETLDTYPAPKQIMVANVTARIYEITVIVNNINIEDEPVGFEDVTDEWLESLSKFDLRQILKLVRDTNIKHF